MVTRWIQTKLRSPDRVERHFAYLILGVVIMSAAFIYMCPGQTPLGATWLCTCWTCAIVFFVLLMTHLEQHAETKWVEWCRLALFLLLALAVLIFFDASNIVNRYRYKTHGPSLLYDEMFLTMDESLFGWIFPRGQITLFLDTNETIGVTSTFGILAAEVLQVLYTSYYLWGNGLGVWLAIQYFWFTVYQQKTGMERKRLQWRRLQMFLTAWLGTFLFNFVLNLTFPAVSPRIYLINEYQNEIKGLFLANLLRRALKAAAANSFSVFPSGHCGLSWLAAYVAHRMGYQQYHVISAAAACLITTATLVLRYHYVVDMVFAWPLLVFGIYFGGFHSEEVYQQSLEYFPNAKHDDDLGASYPHQSPPANLDHELVPLKSIARD